MGRRRDTRVVKSAAVDRARPAVFSASKARSTSATASSRCSATVQLGWRVNGMSRIILNDLLCRLFSADVLSPWKLGSAVRWISPILNHGINPSTKKLRRQRVHWHCRYLETRSLKLGRNHCPLTRIHRMDQNRHVARNMLNDGLSYILAGQIAIRFRRPACLQVMIQNYSRIY